MYNEYKQKYNNILIDNFVKECNTKEKILKALPELKKEGIDPFEENNSSQYSLIFHIFKRLIKSPTEEDKEMLTKIWNLKGGKFQSLLQYNCEVSRFGRDLLKGLNEVKYFEIIINRNKLTELKEFLAEHPNFFKINPKINIYNYSLKTILLCEEAGMEINSNVLTLTVRQDNLKDPAKLFNFISRYKEKLSEVEWDNLIKIMLHSADTMNLSYKTSMKNNENKIGDVFFLIKQLNNPKDFSIQNFYNSNLIYEDKSVLYFSPKNKGMNKEQVGLEWIEAVKSINTDKIFKSYSWSHANNLLDDETIINALNKGFKDLLLNRYEAEPDKNAARWPLFSYSEYAKLYQNDIFRPIITKLILNESSIETNISFYKMKQGEEKSLQRLDIYRWYHEQILNNLEIEQKVALILKNDFNSETFKKMGILVKLENKNPLKDEKIKHKNKL